MSKIKTIIELNNELQQLRERINAKEIENKKEKENRSADKSAQIITFVFALITLIIWVIVLAGGILPLWFAVQLFALVAYGSCMRMNYKSND